MKKFTYIIPLFLCFFVQAQQTLMYTQYTFNKAGVNPAASGTDITQTYIYVFGLNRQWLAFDNAPKSNFVNFSYTIRPPRGYRFWQNVGVYADNDDAGLISNTGAYLSYTFHTLLRKKNILSIGVFAGARRYARSGFAFDANDPAIKNSRASLILYPDIIPGVRISNKKYFAGASIRQITINQLKDFKGHKIGGPSRLYPSVYLEYGRTTELGEQLLMMPSIALNAPLKGIPAVDANLMFYIANRVGLGASLKNLNFASGIFQIRFLKNVTAGFAYSYPINKVRLVAQTSYELMIGITPLGMNTKLVGVNSIVRCPTLTY
jgi:type IX secretion system PorP/SprF family membrane protein